MKKYVLLFVAVSVTFVGSAYARENAASRASELKEMRKEAKETYKEALEKIKDERKKLIVESLQNRLCNLNTRRVETMTKHLDTMSTILDRVTQKSASLSAEKKAPVTTSVDKAKAAILEARTAVANQKNRSCTITLSGSESSLRSEVNSARAAFEQSLKDTMAKVESARRAVKDSVKALAFALGESL